MRSLAFFLCLAFTAPACADDKADGFIPLFNGKNLDGWKERQVRKGQEGRWRVEDGILKAKAGSGWLGTEKQFGDFVLRVDWKIVENGNSGVFFRVPDTNFKGSPSDAGFEIQILDDNGSQYKGKLKPYQYSGGLYHFQPISKPVFKGAGEWNSYELTVKGDHVSLIYNGEKVLTADISTNTEMQKRPKKGFIGLQNHGTDVEFKKVAIKTLD
jgi:3-keto-disaccharide hydrolase